jgi:hypothetical protein
MKEQWNVIISKSQNQGGAWQSAAGWQSSGAWQSAAIAQGKGR